VLVLLYLGEFSHWDQWKQHMDGDGRESQFRLFNLSLVVCAPMFLANLYYVVDDIEGRIWGSQWRKKLQEASKHPHPGHFISSHIRLLAVLWLSGLAIGTGILLCWGYIVGIAYLLRYGLPS
jgi:hypothetical protein